MIAAARPYRDELIGSALIRAGRHYRMHLQALMRHTLGYNAGSSLLYCSHIPELSRLFNLSGESLVRKHSTLPFCTAALCNPEEARILWDVVQHSTPSREAMACLQTQGPNPRVRMFCRRCAAEDLREKGESFWHRSHNLNLVIVCPIHGEYLVRSDIRLNSASRQLPHECNGTDVMSGKVPSVLLLHSLLAYEALIHKSARHGVARIVRQLVRTGLLSPDGDVELGLLDAMTSAVPTAYWSTFDGLEMPSASTRWLPRVESHWTAKYLLLEAVLMSHGSGSSAPRTFKP